MSTQRGVVRVGGPRRSSAVLAFVAVFTVAAEVRAQAIERISVSSAGVEANDSSERPRMSADGRYVAFVSRASNLVAGDTNGFADVFVRDRVLQTTELVSVGNAGQSTTSNVAYDLRISDDGRYVLFGANGLDPADTDANPDVYLRDRLLGTTTWITTSNLNEWYADLDLSADGRTVVHRHGTLFSPGDITIRRLDTGQVWTLQDVAPSTGVDGRDYSSPRISGDGRFVDYTVEHFFASGGFAVRVERLTLATNVVTVLLSDRNNALPHDVSFDGRHLLFTDFGFDLLSGSTSLWLFDTQTGDEQRVDQRQIPPPIFGPPGGFGVTEGSLSANGAHVAFTTDQPMLPGDNNPWPMAFVRVVAQFGSLRADLDPAGQDAGGDSVRISLRADGLEVAFDSWASTLVPGDTNNRSDIFVRAVCGAHYPDLDGDGYGASGATSTAFCLPAPAGWSVSFSDCDDSNATVRPGAAELCDGLDNDCDGTADEQLAGVGYCYGGSNSSATCLPILGVDGCLSASNPTSYTIGASSMDPQRPCIVFYGLSAIVPQPWGSGGLSNLCVSSPRQRTSIGISTAGPPCGGFYSFDFTAWLAANPGALGMPLTPGQPMCFQLWYRDQGAPLTSSLSSAWETIVAP
jgi:Tol biopolymer transport system component